jgi:hypothetical protein
MKKVLVGLAFVTVSLFATDVSQMKILGIGLGDKYENIKKKLPCQDKKNTLIGKTLVGFSVECSNSKEEIEISFDHKNEIYSIDREIKFEIEPDLDMLYQDVGKRYGEPNVIGGTQSPVFAKTYCYGDCFLDRYNDGSGTMANGSNKGVWLIVWYQLYKGKSNIHFTAQDRPKFDRYLKYMGDIERKEKNQQKQEASKIQF